MSIVVAPSTTFTADALFGSAFTGLAGTVGVAIQDSNGTIVQARVTAGISEHPSGSGLYLKSFALSPATPGQYGVVWDTGGVAPIYATEDLTVQTPVATPAPLSVIGGGPAVVYISAHENEPIQQTLYHGDGTVFDGTGYTPSLTLRFENATSTLLTSTGAGVVDWVGSPTLGAVQFTPPDGVFAAFTPGPYQMQWIAAAAGRTKHFAGGRLELRVGF